MPKPENTPEQRPFDQKPASGRAPGSKPDEDGHMGALEKQVQDVPAPKESEFKDEPKQG